MTTTGQNGISNILRLIILDFGRRINNSREDLEHSMCMSRNDLVMNFINIHDSTDRPQNKKEKEKIGRKNPFFFNTYYIHIILRVYVFY
tara:strand:- start:582 stop:848 length:267 start_codon:yes stop_codon:yes gene_type:complete